MVLRVAPHPRPSGFTNEEFIRTDPSEDLVNVVVASLLRGLQRLIGFCVASPAWQCHVIALSFIALHLFVPVTMGIGSEEDERKLQFTADALLQQDPFQDPVELESELLEAVSWAASRSVEQVINLIIYMSNAVVLFSLQGHSRKGSSHC